MEATYSALALVNLLAFLNRGRYRTLTERALRTRLVYGEPHARRMVSYEYLNRQLVWREVSELALFVLPIVSAAYPTTYLVFESFDALMTSIDKLSIQGCENCAP